MAKTRKKRKTVKIRKRPRRRKGSNIASVIKSKWFLNLLVGLMVAGLVALAVERVWTLATCSEVFKVEIPPPEVPEWLNRNVMPEHIAGDEFLSRKHSIFEPGLLKKIAERFEAVPFVREASVRRVIPNRLKVEVEYRVPVAVVFNKYLVDDEGVCLGLKEEICHNADNLMLIPITGLDRGRNSLNPGKKSGGAIVAAASVAKILQPLLKQMSSMSRDEVNPITGISVEKFGRQGESDIVLLTRLGKEIEWGHAAAGSGPDEPTQEEKYSNLTEIYKQSPLLKSYKGEILKRIIKLQWHRDRIVTSD